LIEELQIGPVTFIGLSTGGFVGMRLASRHPELLKRLILLETSAEVEKRTNKIQYKVLSIFARIFGLKLVVNSVMKKFFGKSFLKNPDLVEKRNEWKNFLLKRNIAGVVHSMKNAVGRNSVVEEITKISCPTLILVGEEDVALPIKKAELINRQIKNSELKIIPKAGHSSTIEQPEFVNQAIEEFLVK
jgi:pimeloyl-ACP methyl ester carboxylesterase